MNEWWDGANSCHHLCIVTRSSLGLIKGGLLSRAYMSGSGFLKQALRSLQLQVQTCHTLHLESELLLEVAHAELRLQQKCQERIGNQSPPPPPPQVRARYVEDGRVKHHE